MSKEVYNKLAEELGRDPTDEEVADATAAMIDSAHERMTELKEKMPPKHSSKCPRCGNKEEFYRWFKAMENLWYDDEGEPHYKDEETLHVYSLECRQCNYRGEPWEFGYRDYTPLQDLPATLQEIIDQLERAERMADVLESQGKLDKTVYLALDLARQARYFEEQLEKLRGDEDEDEV